MMVCNEEVNDVDSLLEGGYEDEIENLMTDEEIASLFIAKQPVDSLSNLLIAHNAGFGIRIGKDDSKQLDVSKMTIYCAPCQGGPCSALGFVIKTAPTKTSKIIELQTRCQRQQANLKASNIVNNPENNPKKLNEVAKGEACYKNGCRRNFNDHGIIPIEVNDHLFCSQQHADSHRVEVKANSDKKSDALVVQKQEELQRLRDEGHPIEPNWSMEQVETKTRELINKQPLNTLLKPDSKGVFYPYSSCSFLCVKTLGDLNQ